MIRLEKVRVMFGRTLALDDVDAEIGPGVTGLFGPNGSGKSTLLRVVSGLLAPTSGTVTLDGAPMSPKNENLRTRLGFAGHDTGLYRGLSVRENLTLFGRLYGAPMNRADSVIDALDLHDWASAAVGGLSAGIARRASVARALLHDPDVLLLDEPYANLDDDASELVSEAVRRWCTTGRAAIIATHGAKKVKAFANAGIILRAGRVAVAGEYHRREVATS